MQATSSEFVWCAEGCRWVATIFEYVEALEPPCGCFAWNGRHFDLRPYSQYWLHIQKPLAGKRLNRKRICLPHFQRCFSKGFPRFRVIGWVLPWETKMDQDSYAHPHAPQSRWLPLRKSFARQNDSWPAFKVASSVPNGYYPCKSCSWVVIPFTNPQEWRVKSPMLQPYCMVVTPCFTCSMIWSSCAWEWERFDRRGRNHSKVASYFWKGWHIKISTPLISFIGSCL